jgi:hypothetical protein
VETPSKRLTSLGGRDQCARLVSHHSREVQVISIGIATGITAGLFGLRAEHTGPEGKQCLRRI